MREFLYADDLVNLGNRI